MGTRKGKRKGKAGTKKFRKREKRGTRKTRRRGKIKTAAAAAAAAAAAVEEVPVAGAEWGESGGPDRFNVG